MIAKTRVFLDMIRFEHTVFALPFAYLGMVLAAGGWPEVPAYQMSQGARGEAVAILRQRLEISGDMPASGGRYSGQFDAYLTEGVKRFQYRHGLTPTGVIDQPTVYALNVPASAREFTLRGCGHMPTFDDPEQVAGVLLEGSKYG